ncbi:inositol 1,4,5-trisphosphate receptor-interacting protein-like 1 [Grus americana]|uniref:inositol 1,4,5-trisphosphate receptor-interacting protein-like 1 n=1 Tax=Grus americana TaxID=9117 RepID=UPI002407A0EC|nr:inositol 1,4,5-trisphosphate receptor-interacting protein-like 1 [Grus americana]
MAIAKFFALLVQSIIQCPQMVGDELDEATCERMEQRAEHLSREMTRLLQELEQRSLKQSIMEQRTQEQSGVTWGALLFAALQHWQFWAIAGVLVVLFGLCWLLGKRSHQSASSSKECRSINTEYKEGKEEENLSVSLNVGRFLKNRLQENMQDLPCRSIFFRNLVDKLLCACQTLSKKDFVPQLQPTITLSRHIKIWSPQKEDAVFRLLVPLKPPQGHAFHLELSTAGELPVKNSFLRVELICTCMRERLVGDMLCFLHHPEEELKKYQGPSLLRTLCTGSYLDIEKTARWFQELLTKAWELLLVSSKFRLRVLPCSRSCTLLITNVLERSFLIELIFGVQQGNLDNFMSID